MVAAQDKAAVDALVRDDQEQLEEEHKRKRDDADPDFVPGGEEAAAAQAQAQAPPAKKRTGMSAGSAGPGPVRPFDEVDKSAAKLSVELKTGAGNQPFHVVDIIDGGATGGRKFKVRYRTANAVANGVHVTKYGLSKKKTEESPLDKRFYSVRLGAAGLGVPTGHDPSKAFDDAEVERLALFFLEEIRHSYLVARLFYDASKRSGGNYAALRHIRENAWGDIYKSHEAEIKKAQKAGALPPTKDASFKDELLKRFDREAWAAFLGQHEMTMKKFFERLAATDPAFVMPTREADLARVFLPRIREVMCLQEVEGERDEEGKAYAPVTGLGVTYKSDVMMPVWKNQQDGATWKAYKNACDLQHPEYEFVNPPAGRWPRWRQPVKIFQYRTETEDRATEMAYDVDADNQPITAGSIVQVTGYVGGYIFGTENTGDKRCLIDIIVVDLAERQDEGDERTVM